MSPEEMLAELLERLTAEIRAAGKQDDYCSVTIQPGTAVVFDFGPESDCRGTAWVRLVSANPTASFPAPDTTVNNCISLLAYTVEMGALFPAPVMEETLGAFILPEDIELFEASMRQVREMTMMHKALKAAAIPEKVLGDYAPIGPEGGVLGGTWTLVVGGDD